MKSVNIEEEPVPSPEVIELHRKVFDLEENFKRAILATKDADSRAQFLENLLDSEREAKNDEHRQIVMELEKKLAEVSSKHEEERRKAENAITRNTDLTLENETLKAEMVRMRKEHNDKMANLISRASVCQERDRARIDDLLQKLSEYEEGTRELLYQLDNPPMAPTNTSQNAPKKVAKLHSVVHPTNIFQLCCSDSNESMSYESAREMLRPVVSNGKNTDQVLLVQRELQKHAKSANLDCVACSKKLAASGNAFAHFFSWGHRDMMSSLGAAVSRAAIEYWVNKLQQDVETVELHQIGDPTNIFQLCRPDSSESMSYESARKKLLPVVMKSEGRLAYEKIALIQRELQQQNKLAPFQCLACSKKQFEKYDLSASFTHFLSKGHHYKVNALGAAVSREAIEYWVDKLQSVSDVQLMQHNLLTVAAGVVARPVQQSGAVATAEAAEASEVAKEIKMEEIDD